MSKNIAVLGAGCWGVTLATLLSEKKYNVSLWEISIPRAEEISKSRTIEFLPGSKIPEKIEISSDLKQAATDKEIIVFATPSQYVRETARKLARLRTCSKNCIIINVAKGLELHTFKRMSEIISEELTGLEENICTLSGPSFAIEVINKIPTAVVVAGPIAEILKTIQNTFHTEYFRVYTNRDIKGTELGGALKNIFAIACGISDGIGYGDNTKSALITRGLVELVRLATKLGAEIQTSLGLSGLGDLITTCFSCHSRNRLFGEKIGKGTGPVNALNEIKMVVEGYRTTDSAYLLGKKFNIELPIISEVYYVLYENRPVKDAIQNLMSRELKSEKVELSL